MSVTPGEESDEDFDEFEEDDEFGEYDSSEFSGEFDYDGDSYSDEEDEDDEDNESEENNENNERDEGDEVNEDNEDDEDDDEDEHEAVDQNRLEDLKSISERLQWAGRRQLEDLVEQLRSMFKYWRGGYPDLNSIFEREQMERLLTEVVKFSGNSSERADFIDFVYIANYKDEPKVDHRGKPMLRRTTPLHRAAKEGRSVTVDKLFSAYDRYDLNYADKTGFTHFHAACMSEGCELAVEKFLKAGQNVNCVWRETGDTPLHVALDNYNHRTAELLLKNGANPNLANKNGLTALHVMCKTTSEDMNVLFDLCDDKYKPVQIDARDKSGNTPLHLALGRNNQKVVELLLRRGADLSAANAEGFTPLHRICQNEWDHGSANLLFKICEEEHRTLEIDAVDNLGRTPLQWAVASLLPKVINILLDHGADLSSFVLPTESHFEEHWKTFRIKDWGLKLEMTSRILICVERLEKKGYELGRSDVLTIMKLFANHGVFEKTSNLDEHWYDDKEFAETAKRRMVSPNLSLYDAMRLLPAKAIKLLPFAGYASFARQNSLYMLSDQHREASVAHLCDILARGFCQRWALEFFLTMTGYRLPILCCEKIFEPLTNKDFWRICLASRGSKRVYNATEVVAVAHEDHQSKKRKL
ncbi:uncharacterized protein LOC106654725 [Trichogramma pretiosum]|uniref:uncharacterized protein LOC106654725 n=1 Tax=Trichogramma pretiosum TaxID=7493 RepID=UPI0006C9612D|nr:uncharacterized protein LOC106654725 [Trichogramma pretiosum]